MKRFLFLTIVMVVLLAISIFIEYNNLAIPHVYSQSKDLKALEPNFLPTKEELLRYEGNKLQFLGSYQAIIVNFRHKYTILTNHHGIEIELPITVSNKQKQYFSIPSVTYSPTYLKCWDTFGLAKRNDRYFAYRVK
ncbi:hypothetical protein [Enterococcus faecium]|uniref:hypothetical protein n=1 Tax=Enterococcus faecium TaxID=1352 RepID=UPI000813D138|nr:hypothetical protein [Enterococcus faecium]